MACQTSSLITARPWCFFAGTFPFTTHFLTKSFNSDGFFDTQSSPNLSYHHLSLFLESSSFACYPDLSCTANTGPFFSTTSTHQLLSLNHSLTCSLNASPYSLSSASFITNAFLFSALPNPATTKTTTFLQLMGLDIHTRPSSLILPTFSTIVVLQVSSLLFYIFSQSSHSPSPSLWRLLPISENSNRKWQRLAPRLFSRTMWARRRLVSNTRL